jgi:SAM-dependent methyltransferase
MHIGNREFLNYLCNTYPSNFHKAKVLELGSLDINGSCRDHFTECDYTGIDIVAGNCVDLVVAAKDTVFLPEQFDTVISFSMVEHDPTWAESIAHNMQWLKCGGLFAMCWGGEGNKWHGPEPWKLVPVADMKALIATLPLDNVDIFFEGDRFYPDCDGAFDLIATKRHS